MSLESPVSPTRTVRTRQQWATLATIGLAVVHLFGALGLHMAEVRSYFQALIPANLLLTLVVLGIFHRPWTYRFGIFCFILFWAGFLIELIGVNTGVIFGPYHYVTALGIKVAGTPPLIGVNWLILVYAAGILSQQISDNIWVKSTIGATAILLVDFLIEPMAIRFDFWLWDTDLGEIPIQNYLAWWVIAWVMSYAFHAQPDKKENPLGVPVYLIQVFFFLLFLVVQLFAL